MSLSSLILKMFGWKVRVAVPDWPKCLICVAPHTSNWDFILGKLAYASIGRKAGFLMKSSWFFWPLGYFFRAIGGIPVVRGAEHKSSVTQEVIDRFNSSSRLTIAVTPEGTRSRTSQWHTGFLRIAAGAHVPVVLGAIDAATKTVYLERTFTPTGDIDADMAAIKDYYKAFTGIIPENFTAE